MQTTLSTANYAGLVVLILGVLLIIFRRQFANMVAGLYKKMGIEVPVEKYAQQFKWVGLILLILGFLVSTDLLDAI